MQPNYELFDRLMISIDKYELETKEEKRALIQKAFDLCSFPKDFFDKIEFPEWLDKKDIYKAINYHGQMIELLLDKSRVIQVHTAVDVLKECGGIVKSRAHIIDRLVSKNNMEYSRAYEVLEKAIDDGLVIVTKNGKRSTYALPLNRTEKEKIDADIINDIVEIIRENGGKTNIIPDFIQSIIDRCHLDYREAWRLVNKAVECVAIKVIQNGKRKTYYLPED